MSSRGWEFSFLDVGVFNKPQRVGNKLLITLLILGFMGLR